MTVIGTAVALGSPQESTFSATNKEGTTAYIVVLEETHQSVGSNDGTHGEDLRQYMCSMCTSQTSVPRPCQYPRPLAHRKGTHNAPHIDHRSRKNSPRYIVLSFRNILTSRSTLPGSLCSTSGGMTAPLAAASRLFFQARHWTSRVNAIGHESVYAMKSRYDGRRSES